MSTDKVESDEAGEDHLQYPVQMLSTFKTGSALPDHELTVEVEFRVMFVRNLEPHRSNVNGTRCISKAIYPNVLIL